MIREERITERMIAAGLLPQITKVREDLYTSLVSLRYLQTMVDKCPTDRVNLNTFSLVMIQNELKLMEETLCQI